MEVNISPDKIKDNRGDLEAGMECWYHIPTEEILYARDRNSNFDIDYENWQMYLMRLTTNFMNVLPLEG